MHYMLYNFYVCLPVNIKLKLVHSFLMSHINNCIEVVTRISSTVSNIIYLRIFGLRLKVILNFDISFFYSKFLGFNRFAFFIGDLNLNLLDTMTKLSFPLYRDLNREKVIRYTLHSLLEPIIHQASELLIVILDCCVW